MRKWLKAHDKAHRLNWRALSFCATCGLSFFSDITPCASSGYLGCVRFSAPSNRTLIPCSIPHRRGPIRLYHGTGLASATSILAAGVVVGRGRPGTDFGPGFYTTTLERQAQRWAYEQASRDRVPAAVLALDVDHEDLAGLVTLSFVRGDFAAEDFWSFVVHCRLALDGDHGREGGSRLYDVVAGPVSSFWKQRLLIADVDQISFHSPTAQTVLNAAPKEISWISNR